MSWNESPYWRTARRWGIMFLIGGAAELTAYLTNIPIEHQLWIQPLIIGGLAAFDKLLRENWNEEDWEKEEDKLTDISNRIDVAEGLKIINKRTAKKYRKAVERLREFEEGD